MPDAAVATGLRSPLLTRVLAAVLALLVAAALAWLVVAVVSDDDEGPDLQTQREVVMAAASAYTLAASNYSPEDLDDAQQLTAYRDRVAPLITAAYTPALDQWLTSYTPLVVQGLSVETTVDRLGVEEMDGDSASVLVGGSSSSRLGEQVVEEAGFSKRLTLVKVDDKWLVNADPEDLTGSAEPAPAPSEQPTKKGGKR